MAANFSVIFQDCGRLRQVKKISRSHRRPESSTLYNIDIPFLRIIPIPRITAAYRGENEKSVVPHSLCLESLGDVTNPFVHST